MSLEMVLLEDRKILALLRLDLSADGKRDA